MIQRTIGFDNDHLYDFFVARTPHSRGLIGLDGEGDEFCEKTLAQLFPLPKDRKLFYYFDYGDSWIFQVARTRKAACAPRPGTHYPHLIEKIGENPNQYGNSEDD
ncbi:hypothetical protein [uncultured Thiodictyon sp.]|uniref:IS1096 element passenger TnpR family protein n=1 Tax=uncultured Thiodictyon sp. TaxID=1846217 RepID=UPI00342485C7